jgi:hypothetical protein
MSLAVESTDNACTIPVRLNKMIHSDVVIALGGSGAALQ